MFWSKDKITEPVISMLDALLIPEDWEHGHPFSTWGIIKHVPTGKVIEYWDRNGRLIVNSNWLNKKENNAICKAIKNLLQYWDDAKIAEERRKFDVFTDYIKGE